MIIDENKNEVERGEQGELCILGSSVSYGYINDPQKTKEAFIQNPKHNTFKDIMYRTGDMVYQDEEGLIYFSGRKDHQIKYMGYRIELGEIEVSVNTLGYISECCVLAVIIEKSKMTKIIGFITLNNKSNVNVIKKDLEKLHLSTLKS